MKVDELKKLIKVTVKEAIQEELREILLEAIKTPKATQPITETVLHSAPPAQDVNVRSKYADLIGSFPKNTTELNFNSSHVGMVGNTQAYRPPASANTTGEGSSLPSGEVSLDQIMGLMSR
jgi:hypothetical protein